MCLASAGRIVAILESDPLRRTARVTFGSVEREINVSFVPEVGEGDWILVHAGVAICALQVEVLADGGEPLS